MAGIRACPAAQAVPLPTLGAKGARLARDEGSEPSLFAEAGPPSRYLDAVT